MAYALSTSGKIAKGEYVSEWRELDGGKLVHKYSVCGTDRVCYTAYEPFKSGIGDNGRWFRTHATITSRDGIREWLGDVTSRDIPAEMDALPYGDKRVEAVRGWYATNEEIAAAMVLAAYGEDFE